jgi:hypothetical protein
VNGSVGIIWIANSASGVVQSRPVTSTEVPPHAVMVRSIVSRPVAGPKGMRRGVTQMPLEAVVPNSGIDSMGLATSVLVMLSVPREGPWCCGRKLMVIWRLRPGMTSPTFDAVSLKLGSEPAASETPRMKQGSSLMLVTVTASERMDPSGALPKFSAVGMASRRQPSGSSVVPSSGTVCMVPPESMVSVPMCGPMVAEGA